jgi:hypothetical protein
MPASSIILLFSVALGVTNALPWAGPEPTNAYQPDAWSPVPTGKPADPARLFKRSSVDVNVCGWIGGNLGQPAQCSSGSSCVHDTIHGYVGCCTTSGACTTGVYTGCVDGQSSARTQISGLADNGIYTWCARSTFSSLQPHANYFTVLALQYAIEILTKADITSMAVVHRGKLLRFLHHIGDNLQICISKSFTRE